MQRLKNYLLAFCLLSGLFASCRQDRSGEPNSGTSVGGDSVMLSLSAEVSVDDDEVRALDYRLGKNAKGQLVPMPVFVDKQEVKVHTILKNNREPSTVVAKTLIWRYDAEKKKLVLKQDDGHSIAVPGFNNDGATKWYVSGLIGGELISNTTRVTFAGERVLMGAGSSPSSEIIAKLNVPYAFGWTELSIDTYRKDNTLDVSTQSYKYGAVPSVANVRFRPLGSLIAYQLGNVQPSGDFSLKGFTVSSNAWGDQGEFELNSDIPVTNTEKTLPIWTESSCGENMYYTFADNHSPGLIASHTTTTKTYYAWSMPHKAQPATAEVRVMLKGRTSLLDMVNKDYMKIYFTDYAPKSTGSQGRITSGRVHKLRASATHRVVLPIEQVMDYNLAGGKGLTYTTTNYTDSQPKGVTENLRFATSDKNDQSGYYSWYKVAGKYDATFNPDTLNLQKEVDKTFGSGKYFIPTIEQWWGIHPSQTYFSWTANQDLDRDEYMAFYLGDDLLRKSYRSDWSGGFSADNNDQNEYIYAIRFKARPVVNAMIVSWDYDATVGQTKSYTYPSALDNSLKCAYRFRRIGGRTSWVDSNNENLTNQLVIDVVYLGEEPCPTKLSTISNESWWLAKEAAGLVISKTLPASGFVEPSDAMSGHLSNRGFWGDCLSSSLYNASYVFGVDVRRAGINGSNFWGRHHGMPVRLFTRPNP